jgi:quercetin dioxygenase-like cupin family protein
MPPHTSHRKAPPMSSATLVRWSDVELEQLNPLLTRQYITGSQAMLSRIVLTKGCKVPSHSHSNEQLAFVLQGSLRFVLADGTTHIVNSGEVLVIPGDVAHSAEALEDTINFDIFAPPRQDWIDKDDSYLR